MSKVLILAVAVLPPLFLAAFFLTHFRHRFGISLGAKAVIGGMISAPLALGFSVLLARLGLPVEGLAGAAVRAWMGAAIPEEIAKFMIVWFYIRRHPACDSAGDLFCGSVLVGIGFALLENILYVAGAGPDWFRTGMMRAVLAIPCHTIDGMVMGVFLAWWWRKAIAPVVAIALALILPIMAHGLYDFPLIALESIGQMHMALRTQLGTQLFALFLVVLVLSALAAWWAARAELIEVYQHSDPDTDLHPGSAGALRLWRWIGRLVLLAAATVTLIGFFLMVSGDPSGTSIISVALLPAAFGAIMTMRLPQQPNVRIGNWPRTG